MPLKTNLSQFPYFDDYQSEKDFYRMLWKPGMPVQTRELNQVQSYTHTQIERFADNIFERGTIISGTNFNFYNPYPYVKLRDVQLDSALQVVPEEYVGAIALDEGTGLKAFIVNYADGFEASDPDLKTIYVKYINSGDSKNLSQFTPGNNITITDGNRPLWRVGVNSGGIGFSNVDSVVITSAILVNVTEGTYSNSDYIIDPATGANAEIIEVDEDFVPGKLVLKIKPKNDDLIDPTANSQKWSFGLYSTVTNQSNTVSATVEKIYGAGAIGSIRTNAVGNILEIPISQRGSGYLVNPHISIKTANTLATVGSLMFEPQNFIAKVQISPSGDAVGNGYAFGVGEGQIYDLGYMLRVDPQIVIVEKYTNTPNNKVVGFVSSEEIVDYRKDSSLLDNALGTENETAPGADRLKITPKLVALDRDQASNNTEFLSLVYWNEGNPIIQNKNTQYSRLGDHMAQTVYDQNGNFVLDAFQVTTTSTSNNALESSHYAVVVDPGQAYINGRKVQTLANYKIDLAKGTDTKVSQNYVSLHYGNYIRVYELGGNFDVSAGAEVVFYSHAKKYLSSPTLYTNSNTTPVGSEIGRAKIRSFELENGTPGKPNAVYRLYLFDVQINADKNFSQIKSVHLPGSDQAIADLVLELNATTNKNEAVIKEKQFNGLLFPAGVESLKNSNNSTYQYRTTSIANAAVTTGVISISTSSGEEFFPYGINQPLTPPQLSDFIVVPTESHLVANQAIVGTIDVDSSNTIIVSTEPNFLDNFQEGDFVYIDDGSFESIRKVTAVLSSQMLRLDSPPSFSNSTSSVRRVFPRNVPVPFGSRMGLSGAVDESGQTITLQFGHSNGVNMGFTAGGGQLETKVTMNIERRNISSSLKTSIRNRYIKIRISDNAGGLQGPWCIGVPDAFRLRAVYRGNEDVSPNSAEITQNFYLDHNQNANYMGLGYLYLTQTSSYTPSQNDYLLVCFDYFVRDSAGYYDTRSYLRTGETDQIAIQDSKNFHDLSHSTAANSWEVPQVFTADNKYFDLLNTFDFRPTIASTANPTETWEDAPVNPSEDIVFSSMSKFPVPSAVMRTTQEQYLGRIDDIYIGESGNIYALKGIPDVNPRRRLVSNHPKDSLKLQMMFIPPYPNITENVSPSVLRILNTQVYNEKTAGTRVNTKKVTPILSTTNLQTSQPMVYTMEDIANLERRIKDLEYYQSLSLLETSITNKVIPSSVDRTLNRFKYGFFADDFTSDIYSDVGNPQYAASFESEGDIDWGMAGNPLEDNRAGADKSNPLTTSILQPTKIIQKITNRVTPLKYIWSMKHITENMFFVDEMILSQNNASDSPIINDPCVVKLNETLSSIQYGSAYYTSVNKRSAAFFSENIPGNVTIYFNVYGNRNSGQLGAKITVFNSKNEVVASSINSRNDIRNLSETDRKFLSTADVAKSFHTSISASAYPNATRFSATSFVDYVQGAGKFTFNNASGGRFTIVTETLDASTTWKYFVQYPSIFSVDSVITNKPNCEPSNPPLYRGTLSAGSITMNQWSCSNKFRVNSTNYRAFVLHASGLKPNTVHKLYMDSEEWPHIVNLTTELFKSAYKDWGNRKNWSGGVVGGKPELLGASTKRKVNELLVLMANARSRLYNSDGSPSKHTILTSDSKGQLRCLVFFPLDLAGWFSQDFNATAYGETRVGSSTNMYTTGYAQGKIKPTHGSSGYNAIQITNGVDSSAIRVFANRAPGKNIPADPMGTI